MHLTLQRLALSDFGPTDLEKVKITPCQPVSTSGHSHPEQTCLLSEKGLPPMRAHMAAHMLPYVTMGGP